MISFVNFDIILIFLILTNLFLWFHVIIKEIPPTTYHPEYVLSERAPMEHGAMNNEEQVNDHIEGDDNIHNIVEYGSKNTLIHDTFNVRMDDDDHHHENNEFDGVHDSPLLEKAYEPLYEGSNTNIFYPIL